MLDRFILLKIDNTSFIDDFIKGLLGDNIEIINEDDYKIIYHNNDDDNLIFEALESLVDEIPNIKGVISIQYKDLSKMKHDINVFKDKLNINLKYPIYLYKDLIFELVIDGYKDNLYDVVIKTNLFLDTIKSYIELNMNTSRAADELYMHRNTLLNKIDRFKSETGYDVREFKDAYIIYTFLN